MSEKIKRIISKMTEDINNGFLLMYWITALLVGTIYIFIFQASTLADAFPNYMTSYALADRMTGKPVEIINDEYRGIKGQKIGVVPMRQCDRIWFLTDQDYAGIFDDVYVKENSTFFVDNNEYINKEVMLHTYFAFPVYIVDAIAIIIGKGIRLGPYSLYMFVRLVNLMVYTFIGWITLKTVPSLKHFTYILFLNPLGLQYGSSTSHESLWWPYAWFYVIYISSFFVREKVSKRDCIIITILSLLIAPIKGLGIGFVLLVLLINKEAFSSRKNANRFILVCLSACLIFWLVYNLTSVPADNIITATGEGRFVTKTQSDAVYVSDILLNPIHYLKIIFYTFATRFIYFSNCFYPQGTYYTDIALYGFMGMFIFSLVNTEEENEYKLSLGRRIGVLIDYLILYGLLCTLTLVAWAGKVAIEAVVKIMYVVPFLPLLGLMLKNGKIIYRGKNKTQIIVAGTTFWHIVGVSSIILHFIIFGKLSVH